MLRGQTSICREGVYYAAVMVFVFIGGLIRDINLLMVLSGLMLGPLVFNWRAVRAMLRGMEVRRRLPEAIYAGDELSVGIAVRNARKRGASWGLIVEDTIAADSPGAEVPATTARALLTHVPAGETRQTGYRGRLRRRGKYRFGPLRVTTRFPMGLARRTLHVAGTQTLVVYPRLGRLSQRWRRSVQEAVDGRRAAQRPQGLREGDYHGLRDFRPGDSRRWIHWRTTARRGELMVRQFEQHRNHDLLLVVELWQPERPTEDDLARVETAVGLAATIAADRCREKAARVHVIVAAAERVSIGGAASPAVLRETLERLALAAATSDDRLPAALDEALAHARPETKLVLVGTRSVDLADGARFAAVWADPRKRAWLGRLLTIDVGDGELSEWFEEDATLDDEVRGLQLV